MRFGYYCLLVRCGLLYNWGWVGDGVDDMRKESGIGRGERAGARVAARLPPAIVVVVINGVQGEIFMPIDHLH